MATVQVYRYRVYDMSRDEYSTSTRMATKEQIERIRGEIIPGTEFQIDSAAITEGWTEKNFDPLQYRMDRMFEGLRQQGITPVDDSTQ